MQKYQERPQVANFLARVVQYKHGDASRLDSSSYCWRQHYLPSVNTCLLTRSLVPEHMTMFCTWGWRSWVLEKRSGGVWVALWYRMSLGKRKSFAWEGGATGAPLLRARNKCNARMNLSPLLEYWSTIKEKDFCECSAPEMSRGRSRSWESYEHGQRSSPPGLGEEPAGRGCWRSSEKHQFLWSAWLS